MAVSKPTYQLYKLKNNPFTLKLYLKTLTIDLGCFPFDLGPYRPKTECKKKKYGIEGLTNLSTC